MKNELPPKVEEISPLQKYWGFKKKAKAELIPILDRMTVEELSSFYNYSSSIKLFLAAGDETEKFDWFKSELAKRLHKASSGQDETNSIEEGANNSSTCVEVSGSKSTGIKLQGSKVLSATYGEGIVTAQTKKTISVTFKKSHNGVKSFPFPFPSSIPKYIKLLDNELQAQFAAEYPQFNTYPPVTRVIAPEEKKEMSNQNDFDIIYEPVFVNGEWDFREHRRVRHSDSDKETAHHPAANHTGEKLGVDHSTMTRSNGHSLSETNQSAERIINANRQSQGIITKPFSTVDYFFDEFKKALIQEMEFLQNQGGKRQKLFEGKLIDCENGKFIYSFDSESELNLPDCTEIKIWSPGDGASGTIESCAEFTVIITTGSNLGHEVQTLEFSAEPWRLIQSLVDRLEELRLNLSDIVRDLILNGEKNIDFGNSKITVGQDQAVRMSVSQPITFIWGPPGTGKTQTLAQIAWEHIRQGHRVLMLSYSNVSVDGATLRMHQFDKIKSPGLVVRYGYPRMDEVKHHEYLTSYALAIRNHPKMAEERRSLLAERRKLQRTSTRYYQIGKRLREIRSLLSEEEKKAVRNAKFAATTVSKAVVDKTVWGNKFDVVIFDEASMAYIPQIIFSASLASKSFICMGDFKQLPPIVLNNSKSSLNADIFQYCGISRAVDAGRNHRWLCLLDTQYRMHPEIARFASLAMYNGLLKSAPNMATERIGCVVDEPFEGTPIGLFDLSGMMSVCTRTADKSHINPLSAFLSFFYALQAADNHEVGIITPYNAQARLLHAMARDVEASEKALKPISCATVHQFQGSEKDMIIYDAVDCYRMIFPGLLLTSTENNYADRLFNVALTRAKGKFVGFANLDYLRKKNFSRDLMFGKLLTQMRQSVFKKTGSELCRNLTRFDPLMCFYSSEQAEDHFLQDLSAARDEIRIDIPDAPLRHPFTDVIARSLSSAKSQGVKIVIRAEKKANIPEALKPFAIENQYVMNPITIIDRMITWFGIPFSLANFISEGKSITTKYRPIIRFEGKYTALSLFGFLEMNRTREMSNKAEKRR